ncbi:AbrB/MazE/SpoVT family DNA-binding domain-containing protein [Komagataeibacter sp. NFXK3]
MSFVQNPIKVIYGHIGLPLSENDRFRTPEFYGTNNKNDLNSENDPKQGCSLFEQEISCMIRVNVMPNGRLVLPVGLRKSLGVEKGGQLMAEIVDGQVRLMTPDASLDRARALFRKYVPAGTSISDEVIAERRAENALDSHDDEAKR